MENINIMWEEDLSNNILHLSYKIFYEMNKFNITFIQLQTKTQYTVCLHST